MVGGSNPLKRDDTKNGDSIIEVPFFFLHIMVSEKPRGVDTSDQWERLMERNRVENISLQTASRKHVHCAKQKPLHRDKPH
jgi:hypothetical protein